VEEIMLSKGWWWRRRRIYREINLGSRL